MNTEPSTSKECLQQAFADRDDELYAFVKAFKKALHERQTGLYLAQTEDDTLLIDGVIDDEGWRSVFKATFEALS